MEFPFLSILILLPAAGALALVLLPARRDGIVRTAAVLAALAEFTVSLGLWICFRPETAGMQFSERIAWIPSLGISYALGLDGISLVLVMMTTFLTLAAVIGYSDAGARYSTVRYAGILLFESLTVGVFTALDMVLFCAFLEGALLVIYCIIGRDRTERTHRNHAPAAVLFLMYTMAASLLVVTVMLYLHAAFYRVSGRSSFDLMSWYGFALPYAEQLPAFLGLTIAFSVLLPLIGFHGWYTASVSAVPVRAAVLIAGVLVNIGAYGFLRLILPLFPEVSVRLMPLLAVPAVAGIVYSGVAGLSRIDGRRSVALFSLGQMGLVILGFASFNAVALEGAVLALVSHGICTAGLLWCLGMIEKNGVDSTGAVSQGSSRPMRPAAALFLIMVLASLGFPGSSGFAAQLFVFLGALQSPQTGPLYVTFSVLGCVISAVYLLRMYQSMSGPGRSDSAQAADLSVREWIVLGSLILCTVWVGVSPRIVTAQIDSATQNLLMQIQRYDRAHDRFSPPHRTAEEREVLHMIEDQVKQGRAQ